MSALTASPPPLYHEAEGRVTPLDVVDRNLTDLSDAAQRLRKTPLSKLRNLLEQCLDGVMDVARDWEVAACSAKGLTPGTSTGSEEVANGILATNRYLRLMVRTLQDIEHAGSPRIPGKVVTGPDGRLRVDVFPTRGVFDSIAFSGFHAQTWMQQGVTKDNLLQNMAGYYREGRPERGVAVVMGAGNVSSLSSTDALGEIFAEGRTVLLKMNPVNEYLGPIFERAFASLIDEGFLRIIYGGSEIGRHAINHDLAASVHITGSVASFNNIVWGPSGPERDRRRKEFEPLLGKPITAELGNVTPWIFMPGPYTEKELRYQASNFAASILNNASFNCVATKVLITSQAWPQREQFLDYVQEVFDNVPPRVAYYPGANARFERFAGGETPDPSKGTLPWTLIRDVHPRDERRYFEEESFVCVCVETPLAPGDPIEFLKEATAFCNEQLYGTLGCSITVHPSFRKVASNDGAFQECLINLRYGTIAINVWSGVSNALMCTPWGGYPGATLLDPQSGMGWAHNTFLFDKPEKTILEAPFVSFPKPLWFESTRHADDVCWKVAELYHRPSAWKIPGLLFAALKG